MVIKVSLKHIFRLYYNPNQTKEWLGAAPICCGKSKQFAKTWSSAPHMERCQSHCKPSRDLDFGVIMWSFLQRPLACQFGRRVLGTDRGHFQSPTEKHLPPTNPKKEPPPPPQLPQSPPQLTRPKAPRLRLPAVEPKPAAPRTPHGCLYGRSVHVCMLHCCCVYEYSSVYVSSCSHVHVDMRRHIHIHMCVRVHVYMPTCVKKKRLFCV